MHPNSNANRYHQKQWQRHRKTNRICIHLNTTPRALGTKSPRCNGKPIAETTLKKYFAHELMVGKVEVVLKVLTKFMQAIEKGERWAIEHYMDQRMWREEWGGWRARPHEVAVGGVQSAASTGGDLRPLQLIVQFDSPDPSRRPIGRPEQQ
jgi:hypothetical protein